MTTTRQDHHTTTPTVHVESADRHIICPLDGREWRMFPYAASPLVASLDTRELAPLTALPDDGSVYIRYEWTCGDHQLVGTLPASDLVDCTHGSDDGCDKARRWTTPPDDLWTNARHGGQCVCCGHQGIHYLRRDGLHLPLCKRPAV